MAACLIGIFVVRVIDWNEAIIGFREHSTKIGLPINSQIVSISNPSSHIEKIHRGLMDGIGVIEGEGVFIPEGPRYGLSWLQNLGVLLPHDTLIWPLHGKWVSLYHGYAKYLTKSVRLRAHAPAPVRALHTAQWLRA